MRAFLDSESHETEAAVPAGDLHLASQARLYRERHLQPTRATLRKLSKPHATELSRSSGGLKRSQKARGIGLAPFMSRGSNPGRAGIPPAGPGES